MPVTVLKKEDLPARWFYVYLRDNEGDTWDCMVGATDPDDAIKRNFTGTFEDDWDIDWDLGVTVYALPPRPPLGKKGWDTMVQHKYKYTQICDLLPHWKSTEEDDE